MEKYINQIEKYLRGQLSQEEEDLFKKSLATDTYLRLYAFIMAYMMKKQKSW
jgi:hypothetical protein